MRARNGEGPELMLEPFSIMGEGGPGDYVPNRPSPLPYGYHLFDCSNRRSLTESVGTLTRRPAWEPASDPWAARPAPDGFHPGLGPTSGHVARAAHLLRCCVRRGVRGVRTPRGARGPGLPVRLRPAGRRMAGRAPRGRSLRHGPARRGLATGDRTPGPPERSLESGPCSALARSSSFARSLRAIFTAVSRSAPSRWLATS